jgi:hypothetical protein
MYGGYEAPSGLTGRMNLGLQSFWSAYGSHFMEIKSIQMRAGSPLRKAGLVPVRIPCCGGLAYACWCASVGEDAVEQNHVGDAVRSETGVCKHHHKGEQHAILHEFKVPRLVRPKFLYMNNSTPVDLNMMDRKDAHKFTWPSWLSCWS